MQSLGSGSLASEETGGVGRTEGDPSAGRGGWRGGWSAEGKAIGSWALSMNPTQEPISHHRGSYPTLLSRKPSGLLPSKHKQNQKIK